MAKIDKSYMEKLEEALYDEKQVVNYKMVSIMFGVHVNISKQMLYHFYKTETDNHKKIHATFYISGMAARKSLVTSEEKIENRTSGVSREGRTPASAEDGSDVFLVVLCRDKDLEKNKANFTKIFSVHVYSLSSFSLENYAVLERAAERPLRDDEGRTPIDFGPIMCSASQKLLVITPTVPTSVPKSEGVQRHQETKTKQLNKLDKSNINKQPENKDEKQTKEFHTAEEMEKGLEHKGENQQKQMSKSVKSSESKKKDSNRLKKMFANAKSASGTTSKPIAGKSEALSHTEKEPQSTSVSKKTVNGDSSSRKRKRIRDVLSSSESENELDSDKEDQDVLVLSESPIPRKRIQIDSDSDEEMKETMDETLKQEAGHTPVLGKKRVTKTVSKSFIDKDGFLVTTKEQIMVSEDECEDEASSCSKIKSTGSSNSAASSLPEETGGRKQVKPSEKIDRASKATTATAKPKQKQSSLTSFFQRK